VNFLYYLLYKYQLLENLPHLFKVPGPFAFLIPVAFYYHVRYQLGRDFGSKWIHLFHLFPFVLISLNYLPIFALSSDVKLELLKRISENRTAALELDGLFMSETAIFFLRSLVILFYLFLTLVLWRKEKDDIRLNRKVVRWLNLFIYSYVLLNVFLIILLFISVLSPDILSNYIGQFVFILSAAQFLIMSVYLVLNPDLLIVFSDQSRVMFEKILTDKLSAEDIKERIISEELYKSTDLSLGVYRQS